MVRLRVATRLFACCTIIYKAASVEIAKMMICLCEMPIDKRKTTINRFTRKQYRQ